ncbi:MAG: hypothetical protein E6J62_12645 [Deltaproteobacteria bacterium]|nr:MAG: hypothetical protein E6J62_12645 [Deltaproteobacteria bacterium]TMB34165.1 MAG: hypothetical protein E6J61_03985 [Deltaproteobacteria bacterium]
MDPFELERGRLATYKVDGDQILKTVDGTNWRAIFTYGNRVRLEQIAGLLNDSALGNCDWLRKELRGEPTFVSSCDECALFERKGSTCQHPTVAGRAVAYVATQRPDWCPLVDRPLYLKARPN